MKNNSETLPLIIRYAHEIAAFKEKIEQRDPYHNTTFTIESSYTGMGEILEVSSSDGDRLTISDISEPFVTTEYADIGQTKKVRIRFDYHWRENVTFEGEVVKYDGHYYIQENGRLRHKSDTLKALIQTVMENDVLNHLFSTVSDRDEERISHIKIIKNRDEHDE